MALFCCSGTCSDTFRVSKNVKIVGRVELKWNMEGWLFSFLASYMGMEEIEMNITPCSWAGGAQGYKHYCVWSHLHLTVS